MEEFTNKNLAEIVLFVVLLNVVVFLATAVMHELGHAVLGVMQGCSDIVVVLFEFTARATYTAMDCVPQPTGVPVYASSYLLVLPVAAAFVLLRDFKEQYIGLIMIGGNVLGSAADLAVVDPSPVTRIVVVIVGVIILLLGEDRLVRSTIEDPAPDPGSFRTPFPGETEEEEGEEEDGRENGDDPARAGADT